MLLGAFLDGLVPPDYLKEELQKLPLTGYTLESESTTRQSIHATKVKVRLTGGDQPHRHLSDIFSLLTKSSLSEYVTSNAREVFQRLGEAEALVHNISVEKVHFHEVGAIDSIVDIVGVFICLEYLQVDPVYASRLPVSRGTVTAAHGTLPVPAPATLHLLQGYPVIYKDMEGELVTPTGAALVTHLSRGPLPESQPFKITAIGYGAGSKQFPLLPNVLRLWLAEPEESYTKDMLWEVVCGIDDMNPEWYPHLMEQLLKAGAADVSLIPNIMKKGRPGVEVITLCRAELLPVIRETLFSESTTIGLRYHPVYRDHLPRQVVEIDSPWGRLKVKQVIRAGKKFLLPEFEECRRLAKQQGKSLKEIYQAVQYFLENQTADTKT